MQNMSFKFLTIVVVSAMFAGCGGGGDGESSSNVPVTPEPEDTVEEVLVEPEGEVTGNGGVVDPNVVNDDDIITDEPLLSETEAVFDKINSRRSTCGFGSLKVSKSLTDTATNHAKYLLYAAEYSDAPFAGHSENSQSANPYYSGQGLAQRIDTDNSKGSMALPVSYNFSILSESLSYQIFPDEYLDFYTDNEIALSSINGLLSAPYHLADLVDPRFSQIGIYYGRANTRTVAQQGSVLEMVIGRPLSEAAFEPNTVLSYPCDGITDTAYELNNETPNPFGNTRDLRTNPIGQPIYILGNGDIDVSDYKLTDAANNAVSLRMLTADNDPNNRLKNNQVFLMPLTPLKPNHMYNVSYKVSVDNGTIEPKSFNFKTKAEVN